MAETTANRSSTRLLRGTINKEKRRKTINLDVDAS